MTLVILTGILALAFVPGGLASPAGLHARTDSQACISECIRKNWGWPGHPFSNNPWGSVVDPKLSGGGDTGAVGSGVGGVEASPSDSPNSTLVTTALITAPTSSASSPYYTPATQSNSSTSSSTPTSTSSSSERSSSSSSRTSEKSRPPSSTTSSTPPPPPSSSPSSSPRPSPSPPSPPPSSSGSSGSGSTSGPTSQSDIDAYLGAHNAERAKHGAAPLTYSQDLASKAQQHANVCVFKHSGGTLGPLGENLAAGTSDTYGIPDAIGSWTSEASTYDPGNPQPSHWTQIVWKATKQVGCALQVCSNIFAGARARYYVCEYSVQGNVIGQFPENVQA